MSAATAPRRTRESRGLGLSRPSGGTSKRNSDFTTIHELSPLRTLLPLRLTIEDASLDAPSLSSIVQTNLNLRRGAIENVH